MIGVALFKMMLICLCFVSISSFLLHEQAQPVSLLSSSSQPLLQFVDRIGPNTTGAQINSFVNYINSASTFFRTDVQSAVAYIGDKMTAEYYPNVLFKFSVILSGNLTLPYFDWSINPQIDSIGVYASIAPGADKIFVNNSYMFLLQTTYQDDTRVYFDNTTQKGSGIDSILESVIKNTIITLETGTSCACTSYTSQIADKIRDFDNNRLWNVYCSYYPDLHLNVYVDQGRYIFIKPKNCYYAIFR